MDKKSAGLAGDILATAAIWFFFIPIVSITDPGPFWVLFTWFLAIAAPIKVVGSIINCCKSAGSSANEK